MKLLVEEREESIGRSTNSGYGVGRAVARAGIKRRCSGAGYFENAFWQRRYVELLSSCCTSRAASVKCVSVHAVSVLAWRVYMYIYIYTCNHGLSTRALQFLLYQHVSVRQ